MGFEFLETNIDKITYIIKKRMGEFIMFVTLLLPTTEPYGNPVTFFNPYAHHIRKVEFFNWIASVDEKSRPYQNVELLLTEEIEKHQKTFIEGQQQPNTNFVPTG